MKIVMDASVINIHDLMLLEDDDEWGVRRLRNVVVVSMVVLRPPTNGKADVEDDDDAVWRWMRPLLSTIYHLISSDPLGLCS